MKYITKVNNLNDYKLNPVYPMVCKQGNNIYYRKKYTRLEYISSTQTGGQYIDLGCKLMENTDDIKIDIKFNIKGYGKGDNIDSQSTLIASQPEVSPYPGFVLRKTGRANTYSNYQFITFTAKWSFENSTKENNVNRWYANNLRGPLHNEILDLSFQKTINNVYEETILLNNIPSEQCHNMNCHLFCALDSSNVPFRFVDADLYYLRFTKGDQVIRDLIPVKDVNGHIGLYDNITDKFYTSQGDDSFVAGPEQHKNIRYQIFYMLINLMKKQ